MMFLTIEVGTQELPARFQETIYNHFVSAFTEQEQSLQMFGFQFSEAGRDIYTSRRLAICGTVESDQVSIQTKLVHGPSTSICIDSNRGGLGGAVLGFCKKQLGQALDSEQQGALLDALNQSSVELLRTTDGIFVIDNAKIAFFRDYNANLQEIISKCWHSFVDSLSSIPMMMWGAADGSQWRFVRPIMSLMAMVDDQVIDVQLNVGDGVSATNTVLVRRGAQPMVAIQIEHASQYLSCLEQHQVMAERSKRLESIEKQISALARQLNAEPLLNQELLEELCAIVEWPQVLHGKFDDKYLKSLPDIVIEYVLQTHQRYVPLRSSVASDAGAMLSDFLIVADIDSSQPEVVAEGHQRVVQPRLDDACFYVDNDLENMRPSHPNMGDSGDPPLYEQLAGLQLFAHCGSLLDQSKRLEQNVTDLVQAGVVDIQSRDIQSLEGLQKAARYCRMDQVSQMVADMPTLNGQLNSYYLAKAGQSGGQAGGQAGWQEPADILHDAWLPSNKAKDLNLLPSSYGSKLISLMSRIDTVLVLVLASNNKISGSRDPYGIRQLLSSIVQLLLSDAMLTINFSKFIEIHLAAIERDLSFSSSEYEACRSLVTETIKTMWVEKYCAQIGSHTGIAKVITGNDSTAKLALAPGLRPEADLVFADLAQQISVCHHTFADSSPYTSSIQAMRRIANFLSGKAISTRATKLKLEHCSDVSALDMSNLLVSYAAQHRQAIQSFDLATDFKSNFAEILRSQQDVLMLIDHYFDAEQINHSDDEVFTQHWYALMLFLGDCLGYVSQENGGICINLLALSEH